MKNPWYWTKSQHLQWTETRKKGKFHFMKTQAVFWGVFMFFVMSIIPFLFGIPYEVSDPKDHFMISVVIWPIAAYLYGILSWLWGESFYKKYR